MIPIAHGDLARDRRQPGNRSGVRPQALVARRARHRHRPPAGARGRAARNGSAGRGARRRRRRQRRRARPIARGRGSRRPRFERRDRRGRAGSGPSRRGRRPADAERQRGGRRADDAGTAAEPSRRKAPHDRGALLGPRLDRAERRGRLDRLSDVQSGAEHVSAQRRLGAFQRRVHVRPDRPRAGSGPRWGARTLRSRPTRASRRCCE